MFKLRILITIAMVLFVAGCAGCAGVQRGCSSLGASAFGSNWIVVQYDFNLQPKAAWVLHNTSISNESGSDGIYWLDTGSGHLVHISGWYNRVQIRTTGFRAGDSFKEAAHLIGVDLSLIQNGKYPADAPQSNEEGN